MKDKLIADAKIFNVLFLDINPGHIHVMSLIVLLGAWLSCIKFGLKNKGFVDNIEIDGGSVMNSLIVTYMWVQMGYPTGVCGVRSQMLA